jgi:L-fuconolactonase
VHRPLPRVAWPRFDPYAGYPREGGDVLTTGPSGADALDVGVELMAAAMEAVGVDAGIVYSNPDFCAAAVARHPGILAAVHDLYEPGDLGDPEAAMSRVAADPALLGIRILPGIDYAPGRNLALFTEGGWDRLFTAAEAHGVPFVVFIPLELRHVHRIARRFEGLKLVIDHCGMPAPPTAPMQEDNFATLPDLLELAAYPNVAVKLTGLPVLAAGGDAYPFPKLWPYLHRLLDAFGPGRLIFGTDAQRVTGRVWDPPLRVPGYEHVTYAELVDWLRRTDELGPTEKAQMLGAAARHWFAWPSGWRSPEGVDPREPRYN